MRLTVIAATVTFALVTACSSAGSTRPARRDRVLGVTDQGTIRAYDEPFGEHQIVLEISPDSALTLLAAAYGEIGVEITMRNQRTHEIGNRNFSKYYRLGDRPLSAYLGCGDAENGPAANKRRVAMSLTSTVTPETGGSVIRTQLQGRAEQPEFSTWQSCLTTGVLEDRINKLVEERSVH
jgi:hypothetical protein